jgi:uncharacterized membrane protein YphA (DoxX/SURF4 family)
VEDKPSIPAAILRILVGAVFIFTGFSKFASHASETRHFRHWGLPAPSGFVYVIGLIELVAGIVMVLGLAPRLAGLVLIADMLGAMATAGRVDGAQHLIVPPLLIIACLIIIGSGGGRWALVDRLDPAPPRILVRE